MNIGERIKDLRTEKNISQMELSLKTGLSQSSIARWELNKSEPTASAIIILSKFFNETADYLLGLSD
jgi:transcriptional regulator with XRE-family HTH domain